jgi:hypothetical protein
MLVHALSIDGLCNHSFEYGTSILRKSVAPMKRIGHADKGPVEDRNDDKLGITLGAQLGRNTDIQRSSWTMDLYSSTVAPAPKIS